MEVHSTENRTRTMLIVLAVLIVATGAVLFLLASGMFQPRNPNDLQDKTLLKIPALLEDQNPDPNTADFVLDAQAGQTDFVDSGPTDTLGYNCSYLGPVMRIQRGQKVNIQVNNLLPFPTTVHWHGLVVDGEQDGGPHQGIQPADRWTPSFVVDQPAATLWFHPHFMGTTADQVFYGLAGLIYIDDENSNRLNLPKEYGVDDIPLIVQDRSFAGDGSFSYRTSMMGVEAGDTILINGTVNPVLQVIKGNVRFRILNASNSQNFEFTMSDDLDFIQIASDGGFLEAPLIRKSIFLAPGERAEVIVDFAQPKSNTISLMVGNKPVMSIHLSEMDTIATEVPSSLTAMNRIDEEVSINETEVWIIRNIGGMMQTGGHPFHVHGTQFQIISRNGKAPPVEEMGYKDTVYVDIGEEVVIHVRFSHPGVFMYHCHILEHEDNGMMGQFRVS